MSRIVADLQPSSNSAARTAFQLDRPHTSTSTEAVRDRRHPSPLALEEISHVPRSAPAVPNISSTRTERAPGSPDGGAFVASPSLTVERVRAPNPARKAGVNTAFDAIRAAVTADAVREAANKAASTNQQTATPRKVSAPVLAAAPQLSPPTSPTMSSFSKANRANNHPTIMARTASIDSTVSSISSTTATSQQRVNGGHGYRVSLESTGPQDVASMIATAGSPEAAIEKLLNEKNTAASHNAQLWRLVEKQRAMILGLNRDLEKSLKEKERYRRKLKDHMVQSASSPAIMTGIQESVLATREGSQSPALPERLQEIHAPSAVRDFSVDSRKVSDASDVASLDPGRSDTPQDASNVPSSVLPGTPQSTASPTAASRDLDRANSIKLAQPTSYPVERQLLEPLQRIPASTPPLSPRTPEAPLSPKSPIVTGSRHKKSTSATSTAISPPRSAQSFSSPKQASRKAPPAPLKLSPKPDPNLTSTLVESSDSEYENEPDSARPEQTLRGRRKTREEDDKERERSALNKQDEELPRSTSKKDKKVLSKSKSIPPAEKAHIPSEWPIPTAVDAAVKAVAIPERPKQPHSALSDPAAIVRQRAASDAAGMLQRNGSAPSMLSPGLPMSPRPIDRPLGSPMPRAPIKAVDQIPMSPRVGFPLSPRPPRQPLPAVPQTPLTFASPHLARAEGYHQQAQASQGSIGDRLRASANPSPELERPSTSSADPKTPGEVYRGLVTEQYPDLLFPPNALPSIFVKTASSRMRPSRVSYIAPKHDENPVFTLSVHERSDSKQLWRVEKTLDALAHLDRQVKAVCAFRDRVPDKTLFAGHAPAKIDARRIALDAYFDRMLDSITDEKGAKVICRFLSTDAIGAEGGDYFGKIVDVRPDTPLSKLWPRKEGYLTKRGKNFGGWKARFFVLDGPNLKYFEAPGGAHMGSIKLQNAQIGKQSPNTSQNLTEDEDNQFRHAFLILEPKRKDSNSLVRHVLCAESDDERDAWVDALLQYVDYRDEDEDVTKVIQHTRPVDLSGARSPRLQKSMGDLRPSERSRDAPTAAHGKFLDPLRAVGYEQTVAGHAPVIGPSSGVGKFEPPSPSIDGSSAGSSNEQTGAAGHPTISGPSNAHVIQNAGYWGMKAPPTPGYAAKEQYVKDKKRSIFATFRGRSSSDLEPGAKMVASPGFAPQHDGHAHGGGSRAVFGVPLAEAVESAHPADASTELPAVVYRCIEYLTIKKAIAEEGIFRLSGSNVVIKALRDRFNTEGDVNLAAEGNYYDIHAVAGLLKLYLRELPSSILTRELHMDFLQCLEMHGRDKVVALNVLVNKLPTANRALVQALSAFLLSIVNNADVNKMNVRNVGIVFAPTLNVPAPLISSFVEDQALIFGPLPPILDSNPTDSSHSTSTSTHEPPPPRPAPSSSSAGPTDLRSPRKQMFSDLPTPAYNQTHFQYTTNPGGRDAYDTGFAPIKPSYADYQMPTQQGEGGYGSLNEALRVPVGFATGGDVKARRRESGMLLVNSGAAGLRETRSTSKLREEDATSSF